VDRGLTSVTGRVSDVRIASDPTGFFVTFSLSVNDGSGRKLALRMGSSRGMSNAASRAADNGDMVTVTFDDDSRLVRRIRLYAS
jgi:hypothetical protein